MRTAAVATTPAKPLCVPAPKATVALAADTVSTRWPVTFTIACIVIFVGPMCNDNILIIRSYCIFS